MFRSIEYRLIAYVALLAGSSAAAAGSFVLGYVWFGLFFILTAGVSVRILVFHYRKYNKNILFLLNALDNGDYSFRFSTTKLSRRERELNEMLNRIREILVRAREEVIENEKFLSLIIESVSTGIIIADDTGSIRQVNLAAKKMLGMNILTHLAQLRTVDEDFPRLLDSMDDRQRVQATVVNEREECRLSIELSTVVLGGRAVRIFALNDIADELETAEMESWIKLIRVLTHEIMNSIAPVSSLSETLLTAYRGGAGDGGSLRENTVEAFETINSTARGLLSFVDSYRQFTRIPNPQTSPTDLRTVVSGSLPLLSQYLADGETRLDVSLPDRAAMVDADAGMLQQVIVNLVKNAAEAIGTRPDGTIGITVRLDGHNVCLDVSDNGTPIPDELLAHIFIPFFTTKEKGTGIGLSLSRYIMRLHGGTLKHHYRNGQTVFSMAFPAVL